MSDERLISDRGDKKTFLRFDEKGRIIGGRSTQNVQALVEQNRREANEFRPGSLIGNTQDHRRKVASIPSIVYMDLVEKFGDPNDNPKAWRKWLTDPDNRLFRTDGGGAV